MTKKSKKQLKAMNRGKVIRLRIAGQEWTARDSSFLKLIAGKGGFSITVRANLPQQELIVNIDMVRSTVSRGAPTPNIHPITAKKGVK